MKAAISTDNGNVSAHFGRCPAFTLVEIEDGKMKTVQAISNPGHHPGFLPRFLHEHGVNCIVAGGMGARAQMLFDEEGIHTLMGVTGTVDEVIVMLCQGSLQGGTSLCSPGAGKGYGVEKSECTHGDGNHNHAH
ncbi:MAG: NifB/NifX family molybdenum-iron cluster-binding protein [Spirochaetales bacterium]|nr:NifB/NifX family molybdenum-iron cluster-binding protein [Spirochaetales bacterium]